MSDTKKKVVIVKTSKAPKGAPRRKRQGGNKKPSRDAYWSEGRLAKRKIRNLVRYCRMDPTLAKVTWNRTRHTRAKYLVAHQM